MVYQELWRAAAPTTEKVCYLQLSWLLLLFRRHGALTIDTTKLGNKSTKFYDGDYFIISSLAELSNYRQGFLRSRASALVINYLMQVCYPSNVVIEQNT